MKIVGICKFLDLDLEHEDYLLKDCSVVIDGQNFFFNLYKKSGLPWMYGCEGDKFANYLRKYLGMFKRSNIRCYFIFKGGHQNINLKFRNWKKIHVLYFTNPVFVKELFQQVLDEMGFENAVCEYESKAEIIGFAMKYNCPVISYDIEFAFSGVQYIPYSNIIDSVDNGIQCGLFTLSNFLTKYELTQLKLAIFIALTDEYIFNESDLLPFFKSLKIPLTPYKRNISLLNWLRPLNEQMALDIIYKYVRRSTFEEILEKAKTYIQRQEITGIATNVIENNKMIEFSQLDPEWFEKGVAMGRIAINYVNLYRSNIYFGAWTIEDVNAEDSLICSLDIIIYAYNLLTNFEKNEFIFQDKNNIRRMISTKNASYGIVQKPNFNANSSPFENGWDQVQNLRLFEHFLKESLKDFNHAALKDAPEDVGLLIIALVYFSQQKSVDTTNIVCSVLLSYVMLGVVFEKLPNHDDSCVVIERRPYLDPTITKESVIETDCVIANKILHKYFYMTISESQANLSTSKIINKKLIHPFVEFQHILVQFNNLNDLCGCSYKPTEYSKTFNGTFAYKFLVDVDSNESDNGLDFVRNLLNPAASVLSFFNGLFELYQSCSSNERFIP